MPAGPGQPGVRSRSSEPTLGVAYAPTWQAGLSMAFVVAVLVRRVVGWCASCCMRTDFVLDALKQALSARQPRQDDALIHYADRRLPYWRIRCCERLAEAGREPSVGSTKVTPMTTHWSRPSTGRTRRS